MPVASWEVEASRGKSRPVPSQSPTVVVRVARKSRQRIVDKRSPQKPNYSKSLPSPAKITFPERSGVKTELVNKLIPMLYCTLL